MRLVAAHRGFTLIELVVAIILVGIVSAVVMSRMLRSDAYNSIIVRQELVSMIRSAQQKSIGRSTVVLTLQPNAAADELTLTLADHVDDVQISTAPLSTVTLRGGINNAALSCSNQAGTFPITNADPMVLEFDTFGNLLRGGVDAEENEDDYPEDVTTGARICVDGNPTMSVCISAVGFAYVGDCDE